MTLSEEHLSEEPGKRGPVGKDRENNNVLPGKEADGMAPGNPGKIEIHTIDETLVSLEMDKKSLQRKLDSQSRSIEYVKAKLEMERLEYREKRKKLDAIIASKERAERRAQQHLKELEEARKEADMIRDELYAKRAEYQRAIGMLEECETRMNDLKEDENALREREENLEREKRRLERMRDSFRRVRTECVEALENTDNGAKDGE